MEYDIIPLEGTPTYVQRKITCAMYPIYWNVTIWSLISSSKIIAQANWPIIRKCRKLLIKPVLALLLCTLLCAGLLLALKEFTSLFDPDTRIQWRVTLGICASLSASLIIGVVFTLAQGAMIAETHQLITGNDLTTDSTRGAVLKRVIRLLSWAVITTIAGPLLRVVSWAARGNQHRRLNRGIMHIVGEWNVISFLIVPSIIIDNRGAFKGINRSKELLHHTWGTYLSARVSFGWFAFAMIFPAIIPGPVFGVLLMWDIVPFVSTPYAAGIVWITAGIIALWIAGVLIVCTTINAVFETILHLYAVSRMRDPYLRSWRNLTSRAHNLTPKLLQQTFVPAKNSQ